MPTPPASSSRSDSTHSPRPTSPSPEPRRSRLRVFLILIIIAALGYIGVRMVQNHKPEATPAKAGPGAGMPVPVIAGTVEKKDTPIYLNGIGTVQAFNTVTVNPRVDGEVKELAFTEGQDVKAGDLLAQIDAAPYQAAYDQAVAKQAQDEAQLVNARLNLKREDDLFAKKAVSAQERDAQVALTNDAAAIQSAKVQLDYTRIVAPIAGRTGIRLVDQGNIVHAADRTGIVVLTQLQPISMVFTLPEQDLVEIKKAGGNPADFKVLATDRDTSTVLDTGTLSVIDNQIDPATGTIRIKATFPNDKLQLWPGQFVNARLLLTVRKDAAVVPASVVQRGPQGAFAFVIKEGETVEIRPVKVGPIEQGEALIESGLQAGERVVVDGQYKLQPGSHVKVGEAPHPGAGPRGSGGSKPGDAPAGGPRRAKPDGAPK
jgi:membrane fusion protein, multidrug efflux system